MKGVIEKLFEQLKENRISYAVLRNYETLPEKPLPGSDVDILIDKKRKKDYELIFAKVAKENNVFVLSKKIHFNCLSYFVYQKRPISFSYWVDAFTKIATKSFVWIDTDFLLRNRIWDKRGFYVLSPGAEAATLFLKEVLAGLPVKERYYSTIQSFAKKDKNNFIQVLSNHFGPKITEEMFQIAIRRGWEDAFKKREKWWRILSVNNFREKPITQIFDSFRFFWSYFKEYLGFQKGISIAFIGPDGAGKTTISQGIKNRLEKFPFKKIYCYHGQVGFFPELSKIYNLLSFKKMTTSPYPLKENLPNKSRALLHLFYYGLESFLSWPWFLWGKIRGKIFLFDRYFYDFIATSIHRQIFPQIFFVIVKFIPHPNLTFVVSGRAEKIYQRKKEWPVEEIREQLKAFQSSKLLKLSKIFLIDTEKPLKENLDKIEKEILKFLKLKI